MNEQEPSFEEQLAALRLSVQNIDMNPEPLKVLDQTKTLVSMVSGDYRNILDDFVSQMQEQEMLWQKSETEDQKVKIRATIKRGLGIVIQTLERKPKS